MEIVKTQVEQIVLEYQEFSGKTGIVEITQWNNYAGHTISLDTGISNIAFSLTHEGWDAIVLAMASLRVIEPKKMEK